MATQKQIDSFHEFASNQVQGEGEDLSMAELFDLWEVQTAGFPDLADGVSSVRSALADMEAGDTGQPFDEFAAKIRADQ